jgi:hypothetical protein
MAVKVVAKKVGGGTTDADFVRVRACSDPEDDTLTLATIERVVERCRAAEDELTEPDWFVKTLVLEQPMSMDAALGFATRYAERKGIPVVYAPPAGAKDLGPPR